MKRGINLTVVSCLLICLIFTSILFAISYFNGKSFFDQMFPFYTAVVWGGAVFIASCKEKELIEKLRTQEEGKFFKLLGIVFFIVFPLAVALMRLFINNTLLKNVLFMLLLPLAIILWHSLLKKESKAEGHTR